MKVAVIGLGEAGSHFANDLAELGVEVSGWDPELRYQLHPVVFLLAVFLKQSRMQTSF